jgi:hypothetical protein
LLFFIDVVFMMSLTMHKTDKSVETVTFCYLFPGGIMVRTVCVFLSIALLSGATSAQMRHPVVRETAMDTSMQKMNQPAEKSEQSAMMEREHHRDLQCMAGNKMEKCEPGDRGDWHNGPMAASMMFHPMRHPRLFPALCFMICALALLLINIILTILVSLDMANRHQFNGLWVPVLLLMGLPGTGLYALFRIGDNILAKAQKA